MYFTITAVKKIIRYTEDFVTSRFHSSPDALPLRKETSFKPKINTMRFKNSFINRLVFKYELAM